MQSDKKLKTIFLSTIVILFFFVLFFSTFQSQIHRRYSDFVALHEQLKTSNLELPLPPKKIFGNMEREFVADRQMALQRYLSLILSHHMLSSSLFCKKFLDPTNYPVDLSGNVHTKCFDCLMPVYIPSVIGESFT